MPSDVARDGGEPMSKQDDDLELVEDDLEELDDDEYEEHMSGSVGFVFGLVLGSLLGAAVALLTAPDRGSVVRRRIRTRFSDLQDEARGQLGDWREEARREVVKQRRRIRKRLHRDRE